MGLQWGVKWALTLIFMLLSCQIRLEICRYNGLLLLYKLYWNPKYALNINCFIIFPPFKTVSFEHNFVHTNLFQTHSNHIKHAYNMPFYHIYLLKRAVLSTLLSWNYRSQLHSDHIKNHWNTLLKHISPFQNGLFEAYFSIHKPFYNAFLKKMLKTWCWNTIFPSKIGCVKHIFLCTCRFQLHSHHIKYA